MELIAWDTTTDTFTRGAWFNGRIDERRSDLSSDGTLLVYFASKFNGRTVADREYTTAWTAVSKAPWLTALALWPKGDCWWGGGVFTGPRSLFLNHRPSEANPHPNHRPRGLQVTPNPDAHGEDDPIYFHRLELEGWERTQEWRWTHAWGSGFTTHTPDLRRRRQPGGSVYLGMERSLTGYKYRERFRLERAGGPVPIPGGVVNGANWLKDGRLACVGEGKVSVLSLPAGELLQPQTMLDLTPDRPTPEPPPAWATKW